MAGPDRTCGYIQGLASMATPYYLAYTTLCAETIRQAPLSPAAPVTAVSIRSSEPQAAAPAPSVSEHPTP